MPVLKSYANSSGHYIHASVRGSVVTFQLTERGFARLSAVGVGLGERFNLTLLADLTREGDAFTRRRSPGYHEAEQFELDFKESTESEVLFPACSVTGRFDDLNLVVLSVAGELRVQLLVSEERDRVAGTVHLSVPLAILSPTVLDQLESTEHLPLGCPVVQELRQWFRQDASAEWDRLKRSRNIRQVALNFDVPDELKLS